MTVNLTSGGRLFLYNGNDDRCGRKNNSGNQTEQLNDFTCVHLDHSPFVEIPGEQAAPFHPQANGFYADGFYPIDFAFSLPRFLPSVKGMNGKRGLFLWLVFCGFFGSFIVDFS